MHLDSAWTPHGFLHEFLQCERNFHTKCSKTFCLLGLSSQIAASHLGPGVIGLKISMENQ